LGGEKLENLGNVGYRARITLRRKKLDINKKARSFFRMGLFTSKSFGSLAIAYWQPMALRPTLTGSLPLSALKNLIFMRTNFYWQELVSPCFNYFQLYYIPKEFFVKGGVFSTKNWI